MDLVDALSHTPVIRRCDGSKALAITVPPLANWCSPDFRLPG
jgi:hypothetical protein